MVVESFKPGAAPEIYRRARELGRQMPPGLDYVDSWVDLEYAKCFQLMRTDDAKLFDAWIAKWRDLVDFEVIAVRPSAEAAKHISGQT